MGRHGGALARMLKSIHQRCTSCIHAFCSKTGYTTDQLAAGFQLATGLLIMMACFGWPRAWEALTLKSAAITPVYAVVTFCVVLQANLGAASQFVMMRAAGALVGGALGLLVSYLTYWANGSSYESTTTKGAVMVTLLSFFSFCFGLYRFRYPRWWFGFTVATFSMPMVALNPYWLDYVEYRALWYWWLQIGLGVSMAAFCSTFIFPVTAGRKVAAKTADALRKLGKLTPALVRHMVSMPIDEDGLASGLTGTLDETNNTDTGLSAGFKPVYDQAMAVATNISQARGLLLLVGTEWDVYSAAHTFPKEAYEILLYIARAYLSSVLSLLYPLQSGRLALRAVHEMAPEFCKAADTLAACLERAADCIDRGGDYVEALGSLRELEARWHQLHTLCPSINSSWGENEVLTSDMLVGTLFSLGTRARRVYFTLPEAVHRSQPGARQACYRHFRRSQVWDLAQPVEQLRERARRRAAATPMAAELASPRSPLLLPSPRFGGGQQPPSARQPFSARTPRAGSGSKGAQRQVLGAAVPASPFHHQLMSPRHTKSGAKAYGRLMSWRQLTPGPRLSGFIHLPTDASAETEAGSSPPQKPAASVAAAAVEAERSVGAPQQQAQAADGTTAPAAVAAVDGPAAAVAAGAAAPPAAENGSAAAVAAGAPPAVAAAAAAAAEDDAVDQPAVAALLPVGRPPEPTGGAVKPLPHAHQSWANLPAQSERLALQEAAQWEPPDAATLARRFPPTIYLPLPLPSGPWAAACAWLHERTGFTAEHTALALQLAVAVAGASAIHVTRESYEALKERTVWIVVTVAFVIESTVGGLLLKSGLRFLGTANAGLLGMACLGLTVLCNGGKYTNDPAKFISMAVWISLAAFLVMLNHVRFLHPYGYFWSCSKFTMPIIALAGYVAETVQWTTALWRLVNICIGIGLDMAASALVFPVTTREATRRRVQEVLAGLADLSEAVLLEFVNGEEDEEPRAVAVQVPTSPAGTSGQATPRGAAASTPRRRRPTSVPVTPLSVSEAYEVAIAARARSSQEREERREERKEARMSLERYHSGGSGVPSQGEPESPRGGMTPLSLGAGGWRSPGPFVRRVLGATPRGSRDRSRSTDGDGRTPLAHPFSPTAAGGGQPLSPGAEGGKAAAVADLELVRLEPPKAAAADGGVPLPRAPRSQSSPATVAGSAGASAAAGRGSAVTSPFQLAAHEPHSRPPLPPGSTGHGSSASSSPDGVPRGHAAVPPLQLGPGALPPPSPSSGAATASAAASPQQQSQDTSPERRATPFARAAGNGPGSGGGSSGSSPDRPPRSVQPQRMPSLRSSALPTIVSQQILGDTELPTLPPLTIPLHPMLSLGEEAIQSFGGAAAAPSTTASSPGSSSNATPFAHQAAQQQQRPPAAGKTVRISTDSGSWAEGGRDPEALQRQSTTSTIFYMGTPRDAKARQHRSRWLHERALGKSFVKVRAQGAQLAQAVGHMHELAVFAKWEWLPTRPHTISDKHILAAQHACRKLLNVLLTFAYLADSPDVPHRKLLMPMPREVRAVAEQMGEALRALSMVLDGELPVERALEMVFNLQLQVQLLLLEVEQAGPEVASQADAVLGVAAMGVMFSATQTVQLLYRCVLRLLGSPQQHAAAEEAFAQSAAWGASVEAILVARGVVLSAIATDTEEVAGMAEAEAAGDRAGGRGAEL